MKANHEILVEQARFGDNNALHQLEKGVFREIERQLQAMLDSQDVEEPQAFLDWARETYETLNELEELDLLLEANFEGMCGLALQAILAELERLPERLKRSKDWRAVRQVYAYFQERELERLEKNRAMWLAPRLIHKLRKHDETLAGIVDLKFMKQRTFEQIEIETGLTTMQIRYRLAQGLAYMGKSLEGMNTDRDFFPGGMQT